MTSVSPDRSLYNHSGEDWVPIPQDPDAEWSLAIMAVVANRAARDAIARGVTADDFYEPAARRLYDAATRQRAALWRAQLAAEAGDEIGSRIRAASALGGVTVDELERRWNDVPLCVDARGTFARRVLGASTRRKLMAAASEAHEAAAVGELDAVRSVLDAALARIGSASVVAA